MFTKHAATILALCLAACAGAAAAADAAWQTYSNSDYAFSVDMPGTPTLKTDSTVIQGKTLNALSGVLRLDHGGLVFTASDFSALVAGELSAADADSALDKAVQSSVSTMGATIDKETRITVDGSPAIEAEISVGDRAKARERAVLHNKHIYLLIGVGQNPNGVPPEYERYERSLKMR